MSVRKLLDKKILEGLRTWIEIDSSAAKKNCETFRKLVGPKSKLWAVVKSNAYGHGLVVFSRLANKLGVEGFCVDSLVEGLRLREEGIKKPLLVLGSTLPALLPQAAENNIAVTVASRASLEEFLKAGSRAPQFHIKVDTGMHRQGFYLEDLPKIIQRISGRKSVAKERLKGVYTHFGSAKDINYPTYTEKQFANFLKACRLFEKAGFKNLVRHCAATGAALVDKKYHLDAVRVGIGLYGLWPSRELEMQVPHVRLHPILSWRTVIADIKPLKKGVYVGYDLTERVFEDTRIGILPVGYWHGFPRVLSGIGEVGISGRRARVLGKVSMDMATVDIGGIKCKTGDKATLIGKDGGVEISAYEIAQKAETVHYEFLTRLNPLIERILI